MTDRALTILGPSPRIADRNGALVLARCNACGKELHVRRSKVPQYRSCGCLRRAASRPSATKTARRLSPLCFVPVRATREQYVPPVRLMGRVVRVLDEHGPMRESEVAARCTIDDTAPVTLDDLAVIAPSLRIVAEGALVGDEVIVWLKSAPIGVVREVLEQARRAA